MKSLTLVSLSSTPHSLELCQSVAPVRVAVLVAVLVNAVHVETSA